MNSQSRPYLGQFDALLQACVGISLFASPEGQAFIAIAPFGKPPQHHTARYGLIFSFSAKAEFLLFPVVR